VSPLASALTSVTGKRIALSDVSVSATLHDVLGKVTVCQTYRNDEDLNIEAVYTFPLPLDAVLLDVRVELGGRALTGIVVEKNTAERKYEDTIQAGDAAVMLEELEPGLYTMNVGNLLPKETAKITFVYAIVYRWVGDTLRVSLPTTIAPRYGASPFAPHQAPEFSLEVENQFSLQVEVFGSLREAQFVCPSHAVTLTTSPDRTAITLTQLKTAMDRDFILTIKAPHAKHSFATYASDRDGAAGIASFKPLFPGLRQPRPLELVIVIDCSGSMQGDSIEQAKQALARILDSLEPRDRMTLIAFGTTTRRLSDRLLPCTPANLQKTRQFTAELGDMGGTEIGGALQEAYAATNGSESADIFVVTDGEVSDWQAVVAEAKQSGRRVFTVGVGSAVSEGFVRGLAAATGGACELVSPREGMADRVMRHFERMRAPRARRVAVHWPEGARNLAPAEFGPVFEGDTVIASAQFDRPAIAGEVTLEIETASGDVFRQQVAMMPPHQSTEQVSTVARLAASARLKELDQPAGLEQALLYRLVSPWTNWLVVADRPEGEKAFDIPKIRKVPQTLAAGWGGVGAVAHMSADMTSLRRVMLSRRAPALDQLDDAQCDSIEGLREIKSELSRFGQRADDVNRGIARILQEAQGALQSLRTHAQQVEGNLRALEQQADSLQHEIDTLEKAADDLRRKIRDVESVGVGRRSALREALEALVRKPQPHMHPSEFEDLLVELEKRIAELRERRNQLVYLQESARELTMVISRFHHEARTW
jgi:Ca-activated chloride channel family protein